VIKVQKANNMRKGAWQNIIFFVNLIESYHLHPLPSPAPSFTHTLAHFKKGCGNILRNVK
jgi:hypothetical protein